MRSSSSRSTGSDSAPASRSRAAAQSPARPTTARRLASCSTGGAIAMLTTTPMAAPRIVSTMRSTAYTGESWPMASTSIALIGICVLDPGVSRKTQPTSTATTTASRTTPLDVPSARPSPSASSTPVITPRLRSTALPKVWLMLGCTTSSAAIVAKMGSCAGSRAMQTNQAMIAATDVLTTWTNGIRVVVRTVVVMRTCGLRRRSRVDPSSRGRRAPGDRGLRPPGPRRPARRGRRRPAAWRPASAPTSP